MFQQLRTTITYTRGLKLSHHRSRHHTSYRSLIYEPQKSHSISSRYILVESSVLAALFCSLRRRQLPSESVSRFFFSGSYLPCFVPAHVLVASASGSRCCDPARTSSGRVGIDGAASRSRETLALPPWLGAAAGRARWRGSGGGRCRRTKRPKGTERNGCSYIDNIF